MPLISVIVPVFKVEEYLNRCVDSILAQSFTDFELILIDDGSPDNCGKICDEYAEKDCRIRVIHQKNGGLSSARNAGIDWAFKNSDSQWLTFIDSDDWIHLDYLKVLYNIATETSTNISMCNYIETSDGKNSSETSGNEIQKCYPEDVYMDNQVVATIACAKLYKKECFNTIRFPTGKLHEDEFTTYKVLFKEETVAYCDQKLYYYFINAEGITKSHWSPKRLVALDAFKEQTEYFSSHGYSKAYKKTVYKTLWFLVAQIENSSVSSESASIHRKLKKDLKKQLKKYKKEFNLSVSKNSGFYEAVYPKSVKLYSLITGVANKIKKVFSCHK